MDNVYNVFFSISLVFVEKVYYNIVYMVLTASLDQVVRIFVYLCCLDMQFDRWGLGVWKYLKQVSAA